MLSSASAPDRYVVEIAARNEVPVGTTLSIDRSRDRGLIRGPDWLKTMVKVDDSRANGSVVPTRELILRVASKLFGERGYHGTSTRDIADGVGIRQPSLFHHFSSKSEIMAELHRLEFTPSIALLELAASSPGRPAARLYFAAYVEVQRFLDAPYEFTGTTAAAVLNDPAFSEARRAYRRIQDAQTKIIAEGVESGELISIDPATANRAVEWTIEGVLQDAPRQNDHDNDASSLAEILASFVVRSLLTDTDQLEDIQTEAMELVASHSAG